MPIYEYRCSACEHQLEAFQKMSDAPLTDCPECGQPELNKLISAVAFRLKGGGWYETDFKTGDKKNVVESADKKDTGAKEASKDKKDSKSDGAKGGETKQSKSGDGKAATAAA